MTALTLPKSRTSRPVKQVLPSEGWLLLGAVLRSARWQLPSPTGKGRMDLKSLSEAIGVPFSTISTLETGKNRNPTVCVLIEVAKAGYVINPSSRSPYSAADFLDIACGVLTPLNPRTQEPFTYEDLALLKIANTEVSLLEHLHLRSRLPQTAPSKQKPMPNHLPQILQAWMELEGLTFESLRQHLVTLLEQYQAQDDVDPELVFEAFRGLRLPTEAELRFFFLLPIGRSHLFCDLDGKPLDPVHDWSGTLEKLGLPLEFYTEQPHLQL